ncbi:sushi, nidogen and EGF-like domain-containing protein 1 [Exaiptasia diaphana]|uniref:NIDO domain-containing protein n=1 Tax=Exaiptasia diaphana TaxID=2652724 RepID=A0A913X0S1_EXADI|nr:sushi, nidogen and EGF-like domain-containing protein 1 [Exaiptasia diaphana]XP_028513924.1 sushi, nidogen and EGF-like domain-containing protein 1 [Exaiptasia diaphana]KXJ29858.1 Sushi, nidogen and EGF-like domain-containing protein 1 [Exaiptasia diaphana]
MIIMFSLLILIEMILISPSASIALDELTPFGKDHGDIMLAPGFDGDSGEIRITRSFPFLGRTFTSLYVDINGVIAFEKAFGEFDDTKRSQIAGTTSMIAPFLGDIDTDDGGAIWYRQNTTKQLLEEASTDVRNAFPEFPHFSAVWMFVATWAKVPAFLSSNLSITNTFQSVLLTDGNYSFVRFNYHKITWTTETSGTEAEIGFNAGFSNYYYNVAPNSIRNISILDLPYKSNVNKPGVWMFRTDNITIQEGSGQIVVSGDFNVCSDSTITFTVASLSSHLNIKVVSSPFISSHFNDVLTVKALHLI